MRGVNRLLAPLLTLVLLGCGTLKLEQLGRSRVPLDQLAHGGLVFQKADSTCGLACLATLLRRQGREYSEAQLLRAMREAISTGAGPTAEEELDPESHACVGFKMGDLTACLRQLLPGYQSSYPIGRDLFSTLRNRALVWLLDHPGIESWDRILGFTAERSNGQVDSEEDLSVAEIQRISARSREQQFDTGAALGQLAVHSTDSTVLLLRFSEVDDSPWAPSADRFSYHYVVLESVNGLEVVILDPSRGRLTVGGEEFLEVWTGKVYYLEEYPRRRSVEDHSSEGSASDR